MYREEWTQEKLERHLLAAQSSDFGISYLDDALMRLLPNELMLVGARTGRGKTELATTMAYQMSKRGKRVVFFALEADKWEIHRRMKYRKLAQLYHQHFNGTQMPRYREWLLQGYVPEWDALEREAEAELAIDTCTLRIVYKSERYSAEDFCKEFEGLEPETDVFIVDHLHYFDLNARTETEGLKNAIHAIRNASIYHGKPVVLLAHLRKGERVSQKTLPDLDDFHGHSDIVKVATTVLLMSPVPDDKAHGVNGRFPTYFHLAKCRTASEVTAYAAVMGFDFELNTYCDRYFLQRSSFVGDPQPIDRRADIPKWARHAMPPVEAPMNYADRRLKDD